MLNRASFRQDDSPEIGRCPVTSLHLNLVDMADHALITQAGRIF